MRKMLLRQSLLAGGKVFYWEESSRPLRGDLDAHRTAGVLQTKEHQSNGCGGNWVHHTKAENNAKPYISYFPTESTTFLSWAEKNS